MDRLRFLQTTPSARDVVFFTRLLEGLGGRWSAAGRDDERSNGEGDAGLAARFLGITDSVTSRRVENGLTDLGTSETRVSYARLTQGAIPVL